MPTLGSELSENVSRFFSQATLPTPHRAMGEGHTVILRIAESLHPLSLTCRYLIANVPGPETAGLNSPFTGSIIPVPEYTGMPGVLSKVLAAGEIACIAASLQILWGTAKLTLGLLLSVMVCVKLLWHAEAFPEKAVNLTLYVFVAGAWKSIYLFE